MTGKEKKPQFRDHLPAIVAAAAGTILAAVLGSFLGKTGTLAGMAAGSMVSGSTTWWAERGIRKSAAIAKAKRDAIRKRGRPLTDAETALIERVAVRQPYWHGIQWRQISIFSAIALVLSVGTVSTVEALSGKTLHGVVTGTNDKGYTVGNSSYYPAPVQSHTHTSSPETTFQNSPDTSLVASPSPSYLISSSDSATQVPTATTYSPVSVSPSISSDLSSPPSAPSVSPSLPSAAVNPGVIPGGEDAP